MRQLIYIQKLIIKYFKSMAKISLSSKEKQNIIYLLERQVRMVEKALFTPTMGHNNNDDFKNIINNNNITIKKLQENDTTRKS